MTQNVEERARSLPFKWIIVDPTEPRRTAALNWLANMIEYHEALKNPAAKSMAQAAIDKALVVRATYNIAIEGDSLYTSTLQAIAANQEELDKLEKVERAMHLGAAALTFGQTYVLLRYGPQMISDAWKAVVATYIGMYKEGAPGSSAIIG